MSSPPSGRESLLSTPTSHATLHRIAVFKYIGPGLVVAAAGIGAGDVITASSTGAKFGTTLLWTIALAAGLKLLINENIARWQLATGTTLVEGWIQRLPRFIAVYFGAYLLLWTFLVGGSLINACGLAGHTLFPALPVWVWGILHSLLAVGLVWRGRFQQFQQVMKGLVGLMAILVVICALMLQPDGSQVLSGLLIPSMPHSGDAGAVLAVFGGIGGSVTMMCYGYWIRENGWRGAAYLKKTWADLGVAYGLTAIFGVSLAVIAAGCGPHIVQGTGIALEIAQRLQTLLGPVGKWAFLVGFWCAVFTAMLGVWQGVPYIFEDFARAWRANAKANAPSSSSVANRPTLVYRAALLFLALPPIALLFVRSPVQMVITFTIAGAFVLPFLAATLLYMNNRRAWVNDQRNPAWLNFGLTVALLVFGYVCYAEIRNVIF